MASNDDDSGDLVRSSAEVVQEYNELLPVAQALREMADLVEQGQIAAVTMVAAHAQGIQMAAFMNPELDARAQVAFLAANARAISLAVGLPEGDATEATEAMLRAVKGGSA